MPVPPKRSEQRRRRNKDESGLTLLHGAGSSRVEVPEVDPSWEPMAAEWFKSLAESGQARYFEPSDWQAARLLAHQMSLLLRDSEESGQPIRASAFEALWSSMGDLLTSEGARRKVRVELQRPTGDSGEAAATKSTLEEYQSMFSG